MPHQLNVFSTHPAVQAVCSCYLVPCKVCGAALQRERGVCGQAPDALAGGAGGAPQAQLITGNTARQLKDGRGSGRGCDGGGGAGQCGGGLRLHGGCCGRHLRHARVLQQAGPQPQDTGHKSHAQPGRQRKQKQQRGNGNQGAHPANSRLQHRGNVISMDGPARSICVRLRWSRGLRTAAVDGGHRKRYDCGRCNAIGACAHTQMEFQIE